MTEETNNVLSTEAQTTTAAPVQAAPDKQQLMIATVLKGIEARQLGDLHPVFKQTTDGKNVFLLPEPSNAVAWPMIRIGRSGGIDLPQIRSWNPELEPSEVAINGDLFLAKQTERDQRRADAAKTASEAAAKKAAASTTEEKSAPAEEQVAA